MYPITSAVKALFDSESRQVLRITGTDKNGVAINITDANVVLDSFNIDRFSCNGEKLEVGTAIAAEMTLKLDNHNGTFNGIVFEGTELFVEDGIADWTQDNPTVNWMPCGYFTPDEQPRTANQITIHALDRMVGFDITVDNTAITLPTTVAGLVGQACTLCGVTLADDISAYTNASVAITALPTVQNMTYRNLIQWCAGVMATNAWFDWNGELRFSWYENTTGYGMITANRFSSDYYEDDLTITGAAYTNSSGVEIVEGTDDYTIDLTGNALVGPLVSTVLPAINTKVNGFTYRPLTASVINAPYLWPMDVVGFTDKNGNTYSIALTNIAYGLNGATALESKGMTYAINAKAQPSGVTKEQAQLITEAMEQVETDIDDSLTQQEIFNRLTDNGAAQGLVLYNGQLYINASYINAGELSANYIKGGTLTLGGANNVNGLLQVLNSSGDVIGTWDRNGISLRNGSIYFPLPNYEEGSYVALNYDQSPFVANVKASATVAACKTSIQNYGMRIEYDNSQRIDISPTQVSLNGNYTSERQPRVEVSNDSTSGKALIDPTGFYMTKDGGYHGYFSHSQIYTSGNLYVEGIAGIDGNTSIGGDLTVTGESWLGDIRSGTWRGTAIEAARGGTGQSTYTIGDILYCSAANALSKLSGNTTTTRKFLRSVASTAGTAVAPAWDTITKADVGLSNVENTKLSTWAGSSNITTVGTITTGTWNGTPIAAAYIGNHSTDKLTSGTLGAARGGTGQSTYTIGDILYCSAANTLSKLSGNTTTTRKFLRSVASTAGTAVAPVWDTVTKTDVGLSNVENTKLSTWAGSSNITTVGTIASGTWHGTAIAAAYIGNHSTDKLTSGTLGVARGGTGAATAGPNKVFAGPSSGSASAAPSFRALAAADIPNIGAGKVTSGTFTSGRMIKEKTFTGMTANSNGNWAITGLTLSNAIVVSVYLTSTTNRVPVPWVYYASASSVGQWEIKFLNASGIAIVTGNIAGTLHVLYMEP